jgi:hypothetical protein
MKANESLQNDQSTATENALRRAVDTTPALIHTARHRHRFFDQDSNVDNDIPAIRKLRMEVIMIPWLVLTSLIVILLINFWLA